MRLLVRALAATWPLAVGAMLAGCAVRAARPATSPPPPPGLPVGEDEIVQEFQPDRPDLANSTHIVPVALLQLEAGGQWSRPAARQRSASTPLSLRAGLLPWLEARVESGGLSYQSDAAGSATGFDGLSLGGKIRLAPALALQPAVNLPVGTKVGTDYSLTLITGTDFAGPNHVDANYGLASTAATSGHFFQQWLAVSANRQVSSRVSPYAEIYWVSRLDPGGGRVVSTDFGAIWTVSERFAIDGGADVGHTAAAADVTLFAGLSVIVGELHGRHGVHARLKEAASRRLARAR